MVANVRHPPRVHACSSISLPDGGMPLPRSRPRNATPSPLTTRPRLARSVVDARTPSLHERAASADRLTAVEAEAQRSAWASKRPERKAPASTGPQGGDRPPSCPGHLRLLRYLDVSASQRVPARAREPTPQRNGVSEPAPRPLDENDAIAALPARARARTRLGRPTASRVLMRSGRASRADVPSSRLSAVRSLPAWSTARARRSYTPRASRSSSTNAENPSRSGVVGRLIHEAWPRRRISSSRTASGVRLSRSTDPDDRRLVG